MIVCNEDTGDKMPPASSRTDTWDIDRRTCGSGKGAWLARFGGN